MIFNDIAQKYSDWLYELALGETSRRYRHCSYHRLLMFLMNESFIPTMENDEHRRLDGLDLRYQFADMFDIPYEKIDDTFRRTECSMLEMMLALAIKMEQQIFDDASYGDRTGQWFWDMVVSLGLSGMNDQQFNEKKALEVLDRFDRREFSYSGEGSLFSLKNPTQDMRELEIWYQMQLWVRENVD